MKKVLLIIGIIAIAACVLSLLFALLNLYGYYHALDGSGAMYERMQHRTILFSVICILLAAAGAVCLRLRAKQK